MHRIILSGIKHSGKSTIGWNLSSGLGIYFADLDDLILRDAEKYSSIRELYRKLGNRGFQVQEQQSLEHFLEVNRNKSFVLSLGGGTIENSRAIEILNNSDVSSYFLDAEEDVLYKRILRGGLPPFLEGDDPKRLFNEMYTRRSHLYREWADVIIDTRGLKPLEVSSEIEKIINQT